MEEEQLQLDPETEQAWAEGRVELISQETAREANARVRRYQRLAQKHILPERRLAEFQHWIKVLSALGKYYFHPSIVRLRGLAAAEEERIRHRHHGRLHQDGARNRYDTSMSRGGRARA